MIVILAQLVDNDLYECGHDLDDQGVRLHAGSVGEGVHVGDGELLPLGDRPGHQQRGQRQGLQVAQQPGPGHQDHEGIYLSTGCPILLGPLCFCYFLGF